MKLHFTAIAMLIILTSNVGFAKRAELYSTKYFAFQSNQHLNAHLFLYNKALVCKFGKVPDDSLSYYAFREKSQILTTNDLLSLNNILRFYKDSLLVRDLLFDSLMRNFCDQLSSGNLSKFKTGASWQNSAWENLKSFQPYFLKHYWAAIDSTNKTWLNTNKFQIAAMESDVVPALEKIYKTSLPENKIRIDLTCYATWAGAYSFNDSFCHIVLSSSHPSNKGELASEVVFHETSHFLVDKLMMQIGSQVKSKYPEKELTLWHDMIFYTTGAVLEKYYKLKWQKFEPFYVQMKFQDKFPAFKNSVDACKLYWEPYLAGQVNFDTAITNLVNYVLTK